MPIEKNEVDGVVESLNTEISNAVETMVTVDAAREEKEDKEEQVAVAGNENVTFSDEEKAATEVAEGDAVGDQEAAVTEKASEALAEGEGKLADEVAKEVVEFSVSEETLARAVSVGIPAVDAKALSPYLLEGIIRGREEKAEAEVEMQEAKGKVAVKEEVDPFVDMPKLDPEVHDSSVIAMFEKQSEILKQQHETIRRFQTQQDETSLAVQDSENARLDAAAQEMEQFFDGKVNGLGKDFTEVLGEGRYSSLDKGSPQFAKREEIAQQMGILHSGYQSQGITPPSRVALFDMAARSVLADRYQEIRDKELSGELSKQASQHLQRVGSASATSQGTPEEDTAAEVDAKFFK